HLLPTKIADQLRVIHSRQSLKIAAQEAAQHRSRSNDIRPALQPPSAFCEHEQGMVANHIVDAAVLDDAAPSSAGCASGPMVSHRKIKEAPATPTEHVGFDFIYGIPARTTP